MSKINGKNVTKAPVKKAQNKSKKMTSSDVDNLYKDEFVTPDGFSVARGDDDFYDPVDWEVTPEVRGTVISVKEIELKKVKKGQKSTTRVLSFMDSEQVGWSIWEKKQLESIFNVVQPGTEIIITHVGTVAISGRALPMHKFRCLYKHPQTVA